MKKSPNIGSKRAQADVSNGDGENIPSSTAKRQKLAPTSIDEVSRPKSKKELRQERKAALKAKAERDVISAVDSGEKRKRGANQFSDQREQEKQRRRQERKARKEEKEAALEARFREQDLLRRKQKGETEQTELPIEEKQGKPPKTKADGKKADKKQKTTNKKKPKIQDQEPNGGDLAVFKSIFKKSKDPTTGATTCRLGVQYIDTKVGTGPVVQNRSLVTVKYQLRGGSPHGVLLDSSKKFNFRLGKNEVIQGWEIGLEGMRQGGVRHLIVPPKAGYGSQDIGAGSGAMLHFDITLQDIRSLGA